MYRMIPLLRNAQINPWMQKVGWSGPGVGEGRTECSVGTEFLFRKMKEAWRWMVVLTTQQCQCTKCC